MVFNTEMQIIIRKMQTYTPFTVNKLFAFVLNVNVTFKQIVSYILVYYNKEKYFNFF